MLKFITFDRVELCVICVRHAALLGLVCANLKEKETQRSQTLLGCSATKAPPQPAPAGQACSGNRFGLPLKML